jgi:hypothetical protein
MSPVTGLGDSAEPCGAATASSAITPADMPATTSCLMLVLSFQAGDMTYR